MSIEDNSAASEKTKLGELKLAFEHYRNVESDHSRSVYIKENGRNNRSPHCELIEAVYDVLHCDTGSNAALEAENELLRKSLNKLSIGVRNACTILGGEIFLAEYDKPRLYEPAIRVHNALRKLVETVESEIGGKQ